MKCLIVFLVLLGSVWSNTIRAQEVIVLTEAQKKQRIEEAEIILRKSADNILRMANFQFINIKTGEKFKQLQPKDINEFIQVESRFNSMHYINGPLTVGLLRAGEALNDSKYNDFAIKNFRFIFDNAPLFKCLHERGVDKDYAFRRFFDLKYKDGCCAIPLALAELGLLHERDDVKDYFKRSLQYIFETHERMDDGTIARDWSNKHTIWADDLYMFAPFLARMGRITGEQKYFDEAIKQIENYNKYLYNPATGLYYHGYYSDLKVNNGAHWLRANGWLAVAQLEVLEFLPEDHPKYELLKSLIHRQIVGFAKYQNISGLWHQLIDKNDSYLETSGSAMFIYVVARAVNKGWIDPLYIRIADEGWKGLMKKVTDDGFLEDVCIGTGMTKDIVFYYKRPVYDLNAVSTSRDAYDLDRLSKGSHGLGVLMLAASDMHKAYILDHSFTRKGGGYN